MARTFEQVLAEVKTQSDPQRQIVLKSIADLPAQQAAEEASLVAKKDQAYTDILDGARRRGTGVAFGGIPLGEQARYNATEFAPAVARMKAGFNDRRGTLENALAEMGKNEYSTAYNIYNADRQFEEQQRQFNEQLAESRRQAAASAAQAADLSKYFAGAGAGSPGAATPSFGYKNGTDGKAGFWFRDTNGKPISAATYAAQSGANVVSLLQQMSKEGDLGARRALVDMRGPGIDASLKTKYKGLFW